MGASLGSVCVGVQEGGLKRMNRRSERQGGIGGVCM